MSEQIVAPPPAKPRGWSEKRYRDTYDNTPCVVITAEGAYYTCCGAISAYIVARSYPGSRVIHT